jgi:hypothetical protein
MELCLTLETGGTAVVVESDGSSVVLRSTTAAPPGSIVVGACDGDARPYRIKVRACARDRTSDAVAFRVQGRFVDITREQCARVIGK